MNLRRLFLLLDKPTTHYLCLERGFMLQKWPETVIIIPKNLFNDVT